MFEKEAEDNKPPYAYCALDTKCELWKYGFQKGAEFGDSKSNEWHYVKDGDLPSDRHGHVVINQDWDKVTIRNGRFEHLDGSKADVIAWKEIVLPELKEIE
jgi:hypothetical protein